MIPSDKQVEKISNIIKKLYQCICAGQEPDHSRYEKIISEGEEFVVDLICYNEWYGELFGAIFDLPKVEDVWSKDGIEKEISKLLLILARGKREPSSSEASLNFDEIARVWVEGINLEFGPQNYDVPVIGLALHQPLVIGAITFYPLNQKLEELRATGVDSVLLAGLNPDYDCVATGSVRAETRKARELFLANVDSAVNILRYLSTLIWYNQPARQIHVGQRAPIHTFVLSVDTRGRKSLALPWVPNVMPFIMDSEAFQIANSYGLSHLQSLLSAGTLSPLEESLFEAIAWYGDATRDTSRLHAFVKFYISMEIASKINEENARTVLPNRISTMIYPYDPRRRQRLKQSIALLVEERNAIFHGGKPEGNSIERLEYASRKIAAKTIHQLRELIRTEGIKTKDELRNWQRAQRTHMRSSS
jgi:hypothetical protein